MWYQHKMEGLFVSLLFDYAGGANFSFHQQIEVFLSAEVVYTA